MTNSIGMKLMAIPAGKFLMGSPEIEKERTDKEDLHEVEITKGFWLGKYEVTQEEYAKVMDSNPSFFQGQRLPVENVSWDDAKEFCRKLSETEKMEYRLPTEAEWEYACRAGTEGPFSTGENLTTEQANYNGDLPYAGNPTGLNRGKTVEVGSFAGNAFGLHDMHGNLSEWCEDSFSAYERKQPVRDPKGRPGGVQRVIRGGSWLHSATFCRSAKRDSDAPIGWSKLLGFRVALRQ
jgi:formylglycine-generating enzyme required for sulfatase activity